MARFVYAVKFITSTQPSRAHRPGSSRGIASRRLELHLSTQVRVRARPTHQHPSAQKALAAQQRSEVLLAALVAAARDHGGHYFR